MRWGKSNGHGFFKLPAESIRGRFELLTPMLKKNKSDARKFPKEKQDSWKCRLWDLPDQLTSRKFNAVQMIVCVGIVGVVAYLLPILNDLASEIVSSDVYQQGIGR